VGSNPIFHPKQKWLSRLKREQPYFFMFEGSSLPEADKKYGWIRRSRTAISALDNLPGGSLPEQSEGSNQS
jgi:hypothetical protein